MNLFSNLEENLILSLLISHHLPDDKLIWHFEKKGLFSIKRAYHIGLDMIIGVSNPCMWSFSVLGKLPSGNPSRSVNEWLISIIPSLDNHKYDLILMLSYAIWAAWNSMLWLGKCDSPNVMVPRTISWWQNFLMVPTGYKWTKPRQGQVKLNINGAWDATHLVGEAITVREGLALAYSRGFQNIIVESDLLQIVQALCSSLLDLSSFISFTHIRRQANEVAHRLAYFSLSSTTPALWFEEPPDIILDVLFEDC
ncbi:hypothetical protein D8674_024382 [Pyrus ussuriensis x Pyrus communis]|uniref:RNase H type-1 domain-containing protein n=1 Tax=Pyrus ussuriensis x Pyrus communis TaxID=2448454 RepID=A0A5N5H9U9_9ROSA|nr:hypothetical protein D8674_024382 [Pyrus ussuriensis x Pyrus communis]